MSLIRRGYISSAANVLANMIMANEYDKGAVMQIPRVFGYVYHVASGRLLTSGTFQRFI